MPSLPQTSYGICMQAYPNRQIVLERGPRPRTFCGACEHSEFIHGDHDARRCLYSACACGGFTEGQA